MPVVDLDRISKSYSNKVAVRELSLRIEAEKGEDEDRQRVGNELHQRPAGIL